MGYGGKYVERARARELRAEAWTLTEIANELSVAKASVSVWVRDVDFTPRPRTRGHPAGPTHPMRIRKEAEIARCQQEAIALIGDVSDRDRLMYALALYAGEGAKGDDKIVFANCDPDLIRIFLDWFRHQFEPDESRLRMRLYLHEDLDLDRALTFWSDVTKIPISQFQKPYRAEADHTLRGNRHVHGCVGVQYCSTLLHRRVMGMIAAVTSALAVRDSSVGRAAGC
jgi:hypothetical protein